MDIRIWRLFVDGKVCIIYLPSSPQLQMAQAYVPEFSVRGEIWAGRFFPSEQQFQGPLWREYLCIVPVILKQKKASGTPYYTRGGVLC